MHKSRRLPFTITWLPPLLLLLLLHVLRTSAGVLAWL
jgi:hypothetical protein